MKCSVVIVTMSASFQTFRLCWFESVFDEECSGKLRVGLLIDSRTGGNWNVDVKVLCCCWWSDVECCGERRVVTPESRSWAMAHWAQSLEQPCHPQESRANQRPVLRSRDQPRPMRVSGGRAGATEAGPLAVLRPTLDTVSSGPRLRQLHHRHQWPQRRPQRSSPGSSSDSDH